MGASALQVFVLKDGQLLRSEVFADGAYAIGRDPDCDLVLDDDEISPIHARLQYKDGVATLVDEGSPTGVIVNGDPIESQVVSSTDDIHLGPFLLKLRRLGGKIAAGPVARSEGARRPASQPQPQVAPAAPAPATAPRPPPPPPEAPSRAPQNMARGTGGAAAARPVPAPGPVSDPSASQNVMRPVRFVAAPGAARDVVERTVRDRDLRIVEDEPDELIEVLDDDEAAGSAEASPARPAEDLPKIAPVAKTLETAPVTAETAPAAVKPILAPPPPAAKAPGKAVIAQIVPIAKVVPHDAPDDAVEAPTIAPTKVAPPVPPPAPAAVAKASTPPSPVDVVKPKPAVAAAIAPTPAAAVDAVKPKPPPVTAAKAATATAPAEAIRSKPAIEPVEPTTLPGSPTARTSAPPAARPLPAATAAKTQLPGTAVPSATAAPAKSAEIPKSAPAKLAAKAADEERLVVRVWWGKRLVGSRSFAKGQDVVAAPEEGAALPLYALKGETTLATFGETGWLIKPPPNTEVSVRSGPRDPWRPPADWKQGLAFTNADYAARLSLGLTSVEFSRGRAQNFVRLKPKLDPVFIGILVPLAVAGIFLLRHLPPHTREIPPPPVERFANYIHEMQERAKPPEEKKEIVRTVDKNAPKPIAEAQSVKAATQSLREVEKVAAATRQIDSLLNSLNKVAAPIKGVHNSAIAALGTLPNIPTLGNIAGINGIGDLSGPLTKGLAALGGAGSLGSGTAGSGQVRGVPVRVPKKPSKIQGQIDRDALARVINAHVNDMRACYERSLIRDSNLGAGKVTLEWTIDQTGSVSDVSTKTSTIKNNDVVSCLLDVIRGLKFPKPEGGVVIVSYPILFNSVGY